MKIKSGRKMDIKFSSKLENIYLNEGTYNLLIGAIVLYGLRSEEHTSELQSQPRSRMPSSA